MRLKMNYKKSFFPSFFSILIEKKIPPIEIGKIDGKNYLL